MSIIRTTETILDSNGVSQREMATSERGNEYKQGETDEQIETLETLMDEHRSVAGQETWTASWSVVDGVARLGFTDPTGPGQTDYVYVLADGDSTNVNPFATA